MIKEWQKRCLMGQASIDFQPRNTQLERRKGMRIKGGVSPQERGSRKTEKEEQEREKDRAKYVFAFTS